MMKEVYFQELEKAKLTLTQFLFSHLGIVECNRSYINAIAISIKVILFVGMIFLLYALFDQRWLKGIVVLLSTVACFIALNQLKRYLNNDIDIHLWFADRCRKVRVNCIRLQDEYDRQSKSLDAVIAVSDCLLEFHTVITDSTAHLRKKSTVSLRAYHQQRNRKSGVDYKLFISG